MYRQTYGTVSYVYIIILIYIYALFYIKKDEDRYKEEKDEGEDNKDKI